MNRTKGTRRRARRLTRIRRCGNAAAGCLCSALPQPGTSPPTERGDRRSRVAFPTHATARLPEIPKTMRGAVRVDSCRGRAHGRPVSQRGHATRTVALGDARHATHGGNRHYGLIRSHQGEAPSWSVPDSRASEAEALPKISRGTSTADAPGAGDSILRARR